MSGFQRFVTYINLYEENKKVRSVGFARVERQGEQCRMEIHMRGTGYSGIACPIYLFVRKGEQMAGILIGKLQVTNGTGDGRFQLDSSDLAGSGQDLSRVGGFLIFVNERVMFASQWDEKEILRENFVTWEELEAEENKLKEQRADEENKKAREQKKAEEARGRQNSRQPGQGRRQQFSTVQNSRARQTPLTSQIQSDGQQSTSLSPSTGQQSRHQVQTAQSKPVEVSHIASQEQTAAETFRAASQGQPVEKTLHAGSQEQPTKETSRTVGQEQTAKEPSRAAGQEQSADENLQAAEAAAQLRQAPQQAEEPWAVKWQFILENYPVLTPFEGEEEILCVRLELKDLRLLPKRYWYLGNNSFLLHGFFNYRYLILGAMEQEGSKRWFIGIPGIFQSQEKVMASIFGFTEYKSEKTAEQKTNEFGYWYRFLE